MEHFQGYREEIQLTTAAKVVTNNIVMKKVIKSEPVEHLEEMICRMCLAMDVRMHTITETAMQKTYERITNILLKDDNRMPMTACYICYRVLQRIQSFTETSLKANKLLKSVLHNSQDKLTKESLSTIDTSHLRPTLSISPTECTSHTLPTKDDGPPLKTVFIDIKIERDEENERDEIVEYTDDSAPMTLMNDTQPLVWPKSEPPSKENQTLNELASSTTHTNITKNNKYIPLQKTDKSMLPQAYKRSNVIDHVKALAKSENLEISRVPSGFSNNEGSNINTIENANVLPNTKNIEISNNAGDIINFKKANRISVKSINTINCLGNTDKSIANNTQLTSDIVNRNVIVNPMFDSEVISKVDNEADQQDLATKVPSDMSTNETEMVEKPFVCPHCNKAFKLKCNLTKHIRIHTGEKPHQCKFCSRAFGLKGNLTKHLRIHTGDKPHRCHICNKAFNHNSALAAHIRTHTGEKPHLCPLCNEAFNHKNSLTSHLRKHSGIKPFSCTHCSKFFNQKGDLTKHVRIHTGEKPYSCNHCDKAFSDQSALRWHIGAHVKRGTVKVEKT